MFTSEGWGHNVVTKGGETRAPLDLLAISGNYLCASHNEDRDFAGFGHVLSAPREVSHRCNEGCRLAATDGPLPGTP